MSYFQLNMNSKMGTRIRSFITRFTPDLDGESIFLTMILLIVSLIFLFPLYYYGSYDTHSPKFAIESATAVSPFDAPGTSLLANWNVSFNVRNLNAGASAHARGIKARLTYTNNHGEEIQLAITRVPNFDLTRRKAATVIPSLFAVLSADILNMITNESGEKGVLKLDLQLLFSVSYYHIKLRPYHNSWWDKEYVACCRLMLDNLSGGLIGGSDQACAVYSLWRENFQCSDSW